jgi:hypothetical protein
MCRCGLGYLHAEGPRGSGRSHAIPGDGVVMRVKTFRPLLAACSVECWLPAHKAEQCPHQREKKQRGASLDALRVSQVTASSPDSACDWMSLLT